MALALLLRPRPVATEAVGSARAFESVPSRASPLRVAGQERWCLGAGTLPCKKAAPARTSLRPSVCVCLSARAAPGGPGVLGRDTMITGLRRRSHKTLSFCPPDRPHPRPAIRHAWRKWCTAPNDNRDRSIGARLVVALPRGRGRGPAASQTVGALSFLLVWQRVASSQPPMARRQHAGAVMSALGLRIELGRDAAACLGLWDQGLEHASFKGSSRPLGATPRPGQSRALAFPRGRVAVAKPRPAAAAESAKRPACSVPERCRKDGRRF